MVFSCFSYIGNPDPQKDIAFAVLAGSGFKKTLKYLCSFRTTMTVQFFFDFIHNPARLASDSI